MAQKYCMKLQGHEARLFKSEVELKYQKLQASVKTGVTPHSHILSKQKTMFGDLKFQKLAKLKAEAGATDRVDGSKGKISALELANIKLSAQIDDLILETKREIFGTEATTLTHSNQDCKTGNKPIPLERKHLGKEPTGNSQLHLKNVTPRTKNKYEIHSPSRQDNLEIPCKASSILAQEDKVYQRRPATTGITVGATRKLASKSPEDGHCTEKKNVSKTLYPTYQNPIKRQEKKTPQVHPNQFPSMEYQNLQYHLSSNLFKTSQIKEKQTSPSFPHSHIIQSLPSCKAKSVDKPKLVSPAQCQAPMLDVNRKKLKNTQSEMSRSSSKQLIPNEIKINQMTCVKARENDQLSIDLTHLVGKKEPMKTKNEEFQPKTTLSLSPCGQKIGENTSKCKPNVDSTSHLVNARKVSPREGDFHCQPQVTSNPTPHEDKDEEDYVRQLLLNLTPRSAKTDSGSSRNSSTSISPKNDKSRPWYERLPLPDIEHIEYSPDINNPYSTDSDSSGNVPVKVCSRPRQEYDAWTYLGDQTALMPRPVIRKSCKFVENDDYLSLTDGENESIERN